ncbi:cysteine peptidase family C39 domain-containing protein, partial [uncultured Proteiniphilum sp.]|uniref:cysteine peptidase family C39 domain-containing protein n=1 Tax=uncultured Proteiniphilum sp. TaxID=497637 RepID=UPI0026239DE7
MLFNRFPVEYQMDSQDCGPASLKVIAKHFGKFYSLQYLRDRCGITKEGVSLLDLSTGAESIGLRTLAIKCTVDDVVNSIPFPAIVFWNDNHFVVAYAADRKHIWVSDPAKGRVKYTHGQFRKGWYRKDEKQGVLLAVEPAADFKDSKAQREQRKNSFSGILKYFLPYKNNFTLVFIIMLVVTLLQGVLPFISKAVIDVGIKTSDVNFINMVLIGNISILLSVMVFNVLRDWILMHITSRVNIALISDYLIKLMKLPV